MDDLSRSIERVRKSERDRARRQGFGFTGQASAIVDRCLSDLASWIGISLADRRRSRAVLRAVRGLDNETIARRMLIAGISVAMSKRFGVDENDNKTARDTAVWLGYNLSCKTRDAAHRVGTWGIGGLLTLPDIFRVDDSGVLVIVATDEVHAAMDRFIVDTAKNHPLLSPRDTPPEPWTGVRHGGLPADHWHQPKLVRTGHKGTENKIRHAIATGAMQSVLDAINALQSVAYVINRPILDLVKLAGPPELPDDASLREYQTAVKNWEFDRAVAESKAGSDRCYIPQTMDTRGRLVPIPQLNYIREDRVRSLFLFANGEPINAEGLIWLKQFVARLADGNTFSDESKPSRLDLDGRLSWTRDNIHVVLSVGAAVLWGSRPDLAGLDDPFQFAAACAEFAGVVEAAGDGSDFITRLPIQLDAACSGLQHLCAMSRANEGQYVKLGPIDLDPEDQQKNRY